MEDAEKLTALKRAYADIILNTAKEAAARIMASESRAVRFQQELCGAKDESLRMLLRLKQMMDLKAKEAEVTSLTQQKKIEELEAQLHEAEDIVRDLREELSEVQDELEKVRDNGLQHQGLKTHHTTLEEPLQENGLDSLVSVMFPPDPRNGSATDSDVLKSTSNKRYGGNKCNTAIDSHMEVCAIGKSDLASIIMRNKEPELYRNGCTQRIRAFEGNLVDGKMSLHGQEDNGKNETVIREDEENGRTSITPTSRTDNMCSNVQAVKNIRRKRKRTARYKKLKIPSSKCLPKKYEDTHQGSDPSCSKTYLNSLPSNDKSGENPSIVNGNDTQKNYESPSSLMLAVDATEMGTRSGFVEVDYSDAEVLKPCHVLKAKGKNKGLVDNLMLARKESGSTVSSSGPVEVDAPLAESDLKACHTANEVPCQPREDKFLKYTFIRKRKKASLSSPDGKASLDESTLKKAGEKQNGYLEPRKSSLIVESSRDSRRLAQVALQLISLSEKRW